MPTWATFAVGGAELLHVQAHGERGHWQSFEGGASALAAAGERLLTQRPLAMTVSGRSAPHRLHKSGSQLRQDVLM